MTSVNPFASQSPRFQAGLVLHESTYDLFVLNVPKIPTQVRQVANVRMICERMSVDNELREGKWRGISFTSISSGPVTRDDNAGEGQTRREERESRRLNKTINTHSPSQNHPRPISHMDFHVIIRCISKSIVGDAGHDGEDDECDLRKCESESES